MTASGRLVAGLALAAGLLLSPGRATALDCEQLAREGAPALSLKGREPVQLQLVLLRAEAETGTRMEAEDVARAFASRLEALGSCPAAAALTPSAWPRARVESDALRVELEGRSRRLSLDGGPVGRLAGEAVHCLAGWRRAPAGGRRAFERMLWVCWVESVLDVVGRPYSGYVFADQVEHELAALQEAERGRARWKRSLDWLAEGRLAYLALRVFGGATASELGQALDGFEARGVTGLIIDLRGNSGGFVQLEALQLLAPEGAIVASRRSLGERGRLGEGPVEHVRASAGGHALRLAVLVDGGTGSMAELFAAGLRAAAGAVLIGRPTWGKGIGQRAHPIGGEGMLLLDEVEYFLPGTTESWTGRGLRPDLLLEEAGAPPPELGDIGLSRLAARDPAVAAALAALAPTS